MSALRVDQKGDVAVSRSQSPDGPGMMVGPETGDPAGHRRVRKMTPRDSEKASARNGAPDRVVHGTSAPIGMTDTPSGR